MAKRVSDRQFAESKHQYTDPRTGERLMSVTSIVGSWDPGDKLGAGAAAAVKLAKEGKNYRAIWDAKRDLGSLVHHFGWQWAHGKAAEVPDEAAPYMDAFEKFCNEYEPTWLETERAVVSQEGYGGRFDFIAELRAGLFSGAYHLIDVKTGKPYTQELTMQLAGYKYADGMVEYDLDGWAKSLEPMPHIDECAGLYLHDDGSYDLCYTKSDLQAYQAFKSLLYVKQWAKTTK